MSLLSRGRLPARALLLGLLALTSSPSPGRPVEYPDPDRWLSSEAFERFREQDAAAGRPDAGAPSEAGGAPGPAATGPEDSAAPFHHAGGATGPRPLVATGSSSIRFWSSIEQDLAPLPLVVRGFGGSHLNDVLAHADRLIVRHRPRAVLLYAGENDLRLGVAPARIAALFAELLERVRTPLPAVRFYLVSVKPTPRHPQWRAATRRLNALLRRACEGRGGVHFVDVATRLRDASGAVDGRFYRADGIHLNETGYARWAAAIREVLLPSEGISP